MTELSLPAVLPAALPVTASPPVVTAASLGVIACHHCGTVWRCTTATPDATPDITPDITPEARCQRCNTRLRLRKPDSLRRTWALLIAAFIMYIPANLLPVMVTTTLLNQQVDTIMSGIIYFWVTGAWSLAVIVFIASLLVPLFKLTVLLLLLITAQNRSRWRRRERARLYRALEQIGRWSMLDVFVVSLLTGLVQLEGFGRIDAGVGLAAFASVVVLTMLASLSFDPRLIWDEADATETVVPAESISHHGG
ncbi:paraquat-inducible protein A [Herbaspirillum sp. RTI4]|uniref:paraquat-inducible protein A n=1 Tax=Herbaspirillum sp. RTI4 TaxID=3048640 RepID=UPI002AB520CF|nr:paraquat-inducible protein A [Herbaspirillum sp. RTI4]MDY7579629.1 paraquat-inducible protein A [Herbaspirillum sp. RTI4]MEA9981844.1 paraquat-inducible protein A [Herbaspirillum sp. RTI4]